MSKSMFMLMFEFWWVFGGQFCLFATIWFETSCIYLRFWFIISFVHFHRISIIYHALARQLWGLNVDITGHMPYWSITCKWAALTTPSIENCCETTAYTKILSFVVDEMNQQFNTRICQSPSFRLHWKQTIYEEAILVR